MGTCIRPEKPGGIIENARRGSRVHRFPLFSWPALFCALNTHAITASAVTRNLQSQRQPGAPGVTETQASQWGVAAFQGGRGGAAGPREPFIKRPFYGHPHAGHPRGTKPPKSPENVSVISVCKSTSKNSYVEMSCCTIESTIGALRGEEKVP